MNTRLFPAFTRPDRSRRWVYSTLAALAAIVCVGAVLAQADFYLPSAASSADMSAWISGQIQASQTSIQSAIASSMGSTQAGSSICVNPGTCAGGCGSCTCQGATDTCTSCGAVPCNPFGDLVGKCIEVHLDGDVRVCGVLVKECGGFLILKCQAQNQTLTLTVSIQKILYIESY